MPYALAAFWCLFPVAETVMLCESVRAGNILPCTWIAAVRVMFRSTGIMVTVAVGVRSGKREEAARNIRQKSMVSGMSNQYGFCFGGV